MKSIDRLILVVYFYCNSLGKSLGTNVSQGFVIGSSSGRIKMFGKAVVNLPLI